MPQPLSLIVMQISSSTHSLVIDNSPLPDMAYAALTNKLTNTWLKGPELPLAWRFFGIKNEYVCLQVLNSRHAKSLLCIDQYR